MPQSVRCGACEDSVGFAASSVAFSWRMGSQRFTVPRFHPEAACRLHSSGPWVAQISLFRFLMDGGSPSIPPLLAFRCTIAIGNFFAHGSWTQVEEISRRDCYPTRRWRVGPRAAPSL